MTVALHTEHVLESASEHLVQDLAANVEQALWADDRLRSTDSLIQATADASGAVTLTGHVRGDLLKYLAGRIATRVTGVTAVHNQLVADTDLENDIAIALAMDPTVQTYTNELMIKVILGVAQLAGTISAADMTAAEAARSQAERLARATPGVLDVVNNARAVVGSAADVADTSEGPVTGAVDEHQAAMQSRLVVWKERAQAKRAAG
jgi:osmotically-inducible protein OsmY